MTNIQVYLYKNYITQFIVQNNFNQSGQRKVKNFHQCSFTF